MAHSTTYERQKVRFEVGKLRAWLNRYSIDVLRISLGLVFAMFGILKFIPGASPAEDLAVRTVDAWTLGMISGTAALWAIDAVETFIGMTLITGRFIRTGLVVLGVAMIGSCLRLPCSSVSCSQALPLSRGGTC